jgi:uncharacterized protein (DUF488 family)
VEICTIGFTKKSAAQFFGTLRKAGVEQLVDVRLNNVSQLAGFSKRDDLEFFLRELCGAEYRHEPVLAPTQTLLDSYKKRQLPWPKYEEVFLQLMAERRVEDVVDPAIFRTRTVLLCSEATAERCHRRLVVEYFDKTWGGVTAVHL